MTQKVPAQCFEPVSSGFRCLTNGMIVENKNSFSVDQRWLLLERSNCNLLQICRVDVGRDGFSAVYEFIVKEPTSTKHPELVIFTNVQFGSE